MSIHELKYAFHARSIAVAGASGNPQSTGYRFTFHLVNHGYSGAIYPVTPNWPEVLGLKAYPSLREISGSVDYVICCLPASKVLDLIGDARQKGVKVIHLFTGRFSETGNEDAASVEKEVLHKAKEAGIRLIGPNCMGIYYPKEGIAFSYDAPKEPGKVGMFFQSGGASTEFFQYASLRGIRFSKVVSYGNAIDLNESDFLEYLAQDPETEIIASYIEGVKDGRRFLRTLRDATLKKPVIILKAGRSGSGAKAAASHTSAMAGSFTIWDTAMRQAGALQAQTLEDMINLVVSFCFLPPILGKRVGVVGGGGGKSVLSADEWDEAGFNIAPLSSEIEEEIKEILPELWWGWLRNPVDVSIFPQEAHTANLSKNLLKMMARSSDFDLVISNMGVTGPFSGAELVERVNGDVENVIDVAKTYAKPLAIVLNTGILSEENFDDLRWRCLASAKKKLLDAELPVYPTVSQAARSIVRVADYYLRRESVVNA
ncbi:MAG: CoA-binding protein [Thermodesulfobacteriota bacterium]|nr:CoA-binding protein [Thermodesulfobacteriota bacterium]